MQMHYNESRGYPGAEVEEESPYSISVALWSVNSKILEATRSEYRAPGLILYSSFITFLHPAHVSIITLQRLGVLSSGVPLTTHV